MRQKIEARNFLRIGGSNLFIPQDCNLITLAKIIQNSTSQILTVVNGSSLRYYDHSQLPTDFQLLSNNQEQTEYCFIDPQGNNYIVFGKERADKFLVPSASNDHRITITHKGNCLTFSYPQMELEVESYRY